MTITPPDRATIAKNLLQILATPAEPKARIVALVYCVDSAFEQAAQSGKNEATEQFVLEFIAQAVVSLATAMPTSPGIEATRDAAATYLHTPTEEHWDALFQAATASYPFGPGEGCLALDELGGHDAPGSGCTSGVGFIYRIGAETVIQLLKRDMTPWLLHCSQDA
jgi:hypothetical protein